MKLYEDQLIVVTGGAGFIGSAFVRYLNEKGLTNIVVVDELGTGDVWKNLVGKRYYDILEKDQLFDWLEGREAEVEAFVHLGACSSTVEKDASFLLRNNYQYTVRLAKWALRNEKRFVYASSAATYGDGTKGFHDSHDRLEELFPLNMYGYSKHIFDLWAKEQGVLDDIVGLKYFNVFGPNEYHKGRMASVITKMVPQVQEEGVIRLFASSDPEQFGDGDQKRDFVYVKDVVRMTYEFLVNDAGGIYNIGSGEANTWNALARAVFTALDKPENIEYISMPADLIGKYQNYTCADMDKTVGVLGDAAKATPLEEAVVDYVRNYLLPEKTW